MEYAVAVIDIGMTNKKIAVYDDSLKLLDAKYRNFEPVMALGKSGPLPAHDLPGMEAWFIEELRSFAARFPVKALAVSTHGATFVCAGADGKAALPCLYYTHEPGEDFHSRFYERFGAPDTLQERTGTPAFKAMINSAKGLCFSKEQFPAAFKNVRWVIPYPQYWGLRFTGNAASEATSIGNHTYLWDQAGGEFSTVADGLGLLSLMPDNGKLRKPWDTLGTITPEFAAQTDLSPDTIVTTGIHDSNSALLPHFAKKGERGFILNSTGTWCVIMNPVDTYGFKPEDLGKVVLFNISAFGTPVKTAIFLGGQEFEIWSGLLLKSKRGGNIPGWDEALYRSILAERRLFLLPELMPGSGQFPASRARIIEDGRDYFFEDISRAVEGGGAGGSSAGGPSAGGPKAGGPKAGLPPCFAEGEKVFAALRLSLVMQTLTALERTGLAAGLEVYTEGGFRKDESYNSLLSSALPGNRVFLTDIAEATALGAAMTAVMALGGGKLADLAGNFEVSYQEVEKSALPELAAYREAWLAAASMPIQNAERFGP